jgi:FkbM family methyltransferase
MLKALPFIWDHPLARRQRRAALLRYAAWQIGSRLKTDVEVAWFPGTRMVVRSGMTGFTGNIYCGLHEFADMSLVLHALRPEDRFVDVGANVGSYTILASGVCGASTLAFEPDPQTAAFLRRNIEINGLGAKAAVYEMALGSVAGEVDFTVGQDTTNQVAETEGGRTRRVRIGRLDDLAPAPGASVLKVDVEGYEEHVLAGAQATLAHEALLAILTEGQGPAIVDQLARFGFERAFYDPRTRTLGREPVFDRTGNGLFVRGRDALQARLSAAPERELFGQPV